MVESKGKENILLTINDLRPGQSYKEDIVLTAEKLANFIKISQDTAPAHVDISQAKKMGFSKCIVHGFLVGAGYSRLLGMFLPGGNTVIHKLQLDMLLPVYVDDIITYEVQVERIIPAVKSVQLKLSAHNQKKQLVNRGSAVCVFMA